ncbi:unnamed protein product [Moneuplotes crassus]|uniref:C2H2-type domain-containing protein n=1 Tax=Euplotes crassus TaxID=5936 RepID=A0AAD1U880_EUPCR|nr:unnamed protein product [Moneuplotes crassus]
MDMNACDKDIPYFVFGGYAEMFSILAKDQSYTKEIILSQMDPSIASQYCSCEAQASKKDIPILPSLNEINFLDQNRTDKFQLFNSGNTRKIIKDMDKTFDMDKSENLIAKALENHTDSQKEGIKTGNNFITYYEVMINLLSLLTHKYLDNEGNPMYLIRKLKRVIKKTQAQYHYDCMMESCKRTFNSFSDLKTHIVLHDKFRPFKCPYCPKCYTQKGNMIKHKRSHFNPSLNSRRRFTCEFCHKRYTEKYNLKTHQQKFHPMEYQQRYGFRGFFA